MIKHGFGDFSGDGWLCRDMTDKLCWRGEIGRPQSYTTGDPSHRPSNRLRYFASKGRKLWDCHGFKTRDSIPIWGYFALSGRRTQMKGLPSLPLFFSFYHLCLSCLCLTIFPTCDTNVRQSNNG